MNTCSTCSRYSGGKCGLDDGYINVDAKCGQWASKTKTVEVSREVAAEVYRLNGLVQEQAREIERQERMIKAACEGADKIGTCDYCPALGVCGACDNYPLNCANEYRKWLEMEVMK